MPTLVQRFTPGYVYHRYTPPASDPSIGLTKVPPYLSAASNPILPFSYDPPFYKSSKSHKPPERYGFSIHVAMPITLSSISILTYYKEAIEHKCWQQPMKAELQALEANHIWDIISCPPHVKPIGSRWVYTVKLKFDGFLNRYKA